MKTISIKPAAWRNWMKIFFSVNRVPAATKASTTTTGTNQADQQSIARTAYRGNYFAGPHCIFDPRYF